MMKAEEIIKGLESLEGLLKKDSLMNFIKELYDSIQQLQQEVKRLETMHKVNTVDLVQAEKKYKDLLQRAREIHKRENKSVDGEWTAICLEELFGEENLKQ